MKTMRSACWIVLVLIFAAACGSPPKEEIDAAKRALDQAREAGAKLYAPKAMAVAEKQASKLDKDIFIQGKNFFNHPESLKVEAYKLLKLAHIARKEAEEARKQVRVSTEAVIAAADTSVFEARRLEGNSHGAASTANLLREASEDVEKARREMSAGRFLEARKSARKAQAGATAVLSRLRGKDYPPTTPRS